MLLVAGCRLRYLLAIGVVVSRAGQFIIAEPSARPPHRVPKRLAGYGATRIAIQSLATTLNVFRQWSRFRRTEVRLPPEDHTDFIFAVVAETGAVGSFLVIFVQR
jgi:cell division protein FtsW (lipid II flippase)